MLEHIHVNSFAVILAAAAYFLLGALWYSPKLFGQCWSHEAGVVPCKGHSFFSYVGEFIVDLVIAYVLAIILHIFNVSLITEGLAAALWIWVGFIATSHISAMLWGKKTFKSFVINGGFSLIGLLLMSVILVLLKNYHLESQI